VGSSLLERKYGTWVINKGLRLLLREETCLTFRDDEADEFARNTDGKEPLVGADLATAVVVAVAVTVAEKAPDFMFISLLLLQCASRWISGGRGSSLERPCMLLPLLLLAGNRSSCAMVDSCRVSLSSDCSNVVVEQRRMRIILCST
jgi:hypothetical protein